MIVSSVNIQYMIYSLKERKNFDIMLCQYAQKAVDKYSNYLESYFIEILFPVFCFVTKQKSVRFQINLKIVNAIIWSLLEWKHESYLWVYNLDDFSCVVLHSNFLGCLTCLRHCFCVDVAVKVWLMSPCPRYRDRCSHGMISLWFFFLMERLYWYIYIYRHWYM